MKSALKIFLRKANFSDIEFLWYLRNQPEVFRYFRKPEKVTWKKHINWIVPLILGLTKRELFVIEVFEKPVGQIRFDYKKGQTEMSISLLKDFQGKGLGKRCLEAGIKEVKKAGKVKQLLAGIHKDNIPSIKLFEKFNFKLQTKKGVWLNYVLKL